MKVNVHNQCLDFKLKYRGCFSAGINWTKRLDVKVNAGYTTRAVLKSPYVASKGSLMYQLQRKHIKYDGQLKPTYILLFVAWKLEGYKELHVCIRLIEYDKRIVWNGYKQEDYYQRYADQLSKYTGPIKNTWLTHDGTVLMTRLGLDFTKRNVLYITISEGTKNSHTRKPVWLDPKM
jgi:hypothetical protein